MTEQQHINQCDKRLIMKRFRQTGELPLGRYRDEYGDTPDQELDFHEMHNRLASVRSAFHHLPDEVKANYRDEYDFVNAINDPARTSQLISDGILEEMNAKLAGGDPEALTEALSENEAPSTPANTEQSEGAEGTSEASQSLT